MISSKTRIARSHSLGFKGCDERTITHLIGSDIKWKYTSRKFALHSLAFCLDAFFDQPSHFSARRMLHVVNNTPNSSNRKTAISSRYKWGFSTKWSQRTWTIRGVRLRGHPLLFGGAVTLRNNRTLERCLLIVRLWQSAALAICDAVSSLLTIIP